MDTNVTPIITGAEALTLQAALEALCDTRRVIESAHGRLDAQVVDARRAGASWDEISHATGYSVTHSHRRWNALCSMFGAGRSYRRARSA